LENRINFIKIGIRAFGSGGSDGSRRSKVGIEKFNGIDFGYWKM
jgi:hypothetical protein